MRETYVSKIGPVIAGAAVPLAMLGFTFTASANDDMQYGDDSDYHHSSWMDQTHMNDGMHQWNAKLTGSEEVPPVNEGVSGDSRVWMNDDGSTMRFDLSVWNGHDVTMSHLHCAPKGVNGPVVVTLFHNDNGVNVNGALSSGDITNSAMATTGVNCKDTIGYEVKTTSDLMKAIKEGNIYVNVHTKAHPAGAARGQLMDGGIVHSDNQNGNKDDHGSYNNSDDCNNTEHYSDQNRRDDQNDHRDYSDNQDAHHDQYQKEDDHHYSDNRDYRDDNQYSDNRHDENNYGDGSDGKDGKDGEEGKNGDNGNHYVWQNNKHDDEYADRNRNLDHESGHHDYSWGESRMSGVNISADAHAMADGLRADAHARLGY